MAIWLMFTASSFMAGCGSTYILAVTSSQSSVEFNQEPYITKSITPALPSGGTSHVAVRPPDHCIQQGAGQIDGRGNLDQLTLNTSCGVWLAELERALVEKGYIVVSWQSVMGEHGGQEFEKAAARGVNLIIIVNSLSSDTVMGDASDTKKVTFYRSNPNKVRSQDWAAPPVYKNSMLSQLSTEVTSQSDQLAATLDATVINAENQQAIWFYRHSVSTPAASAGEDERLFTCGEGRCVPRWQVQQTTPQPPPANTSQVTFSDAQASRPTDLRQKERYELSSQVTRHFVDVFSKYTRGASSAKTPAPPPAVKTP